MSFISLIYFFVIAVYLLIGAAIIFHMLRYKINRRASAVMFLIYFAGSVFLLFSNYILFRSVPWYEILSSFKF